MNDLSRLTASELDAVFAVELAGHTATDVELAARRGDPLPPFSTSVDALMPWLEEVGKTRAFFNVKMLRTWEGYKVEIDQSGDEEKTDATAATLPRATAEALILWKRGQK